MREIHPEGSQIIIICLPTELYILTRKVLNVILQKAVKIQMNETKTNIILFSTLLLLYHKSVFYMLATLVISLW